MSHSCFSSFAEETADQFVDLRRALRLVAAACFNEADTRRFVGHGRLLAGELRQLVRSPPRLRLDQRDALVLDNLSKPGTVCSH